MVRFPIFMGFHGPDRSERDCSGVRIAGGGSAIMEEVTHQLEVSFSPSGNNVTWVGDVGGNPSSCRSCCGACSSEGRIRDLSPGTSDRFAQGPDPFIIHQEKFLKVVHALSVRYEGCNSRGKPHTGQCGM